MSVYKGDLYPGCTVFGSFTTVTTTGAPTVLTGNPAPRLVAYKDANASCSTTGLTLAVNCNGRTGWNGYSVITTDAFYSCGHDYEIVIDGGTVGGTCVSGYVVASFSLVNRSGLLPQNYGKRLTLTTGGAVNINWAGVENCTNATGLTCTSIFTASDVTNEVNINPCSTVFSVVSKVETHPCSTIFSAQKLIDTSNIGTGAAPSANSIACTVWNSLKADYTIADSFGCYLDAKVSSIQAGSGPSANSIACTVWESLFTSHSATCGTYGYLLNCQVSAALQPTTPGRRLDVTATGAAGIDWGNVENPTTAVTLSCTTAYSVVKVTDQVTTHPCSTVFSTQSVLNNVNINPCSTVFSVASKVEAHPCSRILSVQSVLNNVPGVTGNVGGNVVGDVQGNVDGSVGSVTAAVTVGTNNDKTGYSLSAAGYACVWSAPIHEPANVPGWPMSGCTALGWIAALASNCVTQTATTQSLCNRAVSSTIASAPLTCEATIVRRGTFGTVIP